VSPTTTIRHSASSARAIPLFFTVRGVLQLFTKVIVSRILIRDFRARVFENFPEIGKIVSVF
jgi:hypothetical protein